MHSPFYICNLAELGHFVKWGSAGNASTARAGFGKSDTSPPLHQWISHSRFHCCLKLSRNSNIPFAN